MNNESSNTGRISPERMAAVLRKVRKEKYITGDDTAVIFYDLSLIESNIARLKYHTGDIEALHTSAVKANPLVSVLAKLIELDIGVETATLPELYMALETGFAPDRIVFDSPAKTIVELEYAIERNVHMNADSPEELSRIANILKRIETKSTFGLRVNPQVGSGDIEITSTAGKHSKFGVPLDRFKDQIIEAYGKYSWLTGIHVHIGSQGMPLDKLVEGIRKLYDLAEEINQLLEKRGAGNRIEIVDIGGGMPVTYLENTPMPNIDDYFGKLKTAVPGLFSGKYKIITEFGRYIHANAGWAISRVEYVKNYDKKNYAVIHLGADMFIRECYDRGNWPHEFSALTSEGKIKLGKQVKYDIAGPLCFSGDIISEKVKLPELNPGDYVTIHDTGAYTTSMWSRYNSRQMPTIIGYYNDGEKIEVLKHRESLMDIYKFWK